MATSYVNVDSICNAARNVPLVGNHISQSEDDNGNENVCPSLTFQQRIIGFGICMGLSFLFSILAWISIFMLEFNTFAFINTAANLTSIGSTCFLCGPMTQLRRMFDPTRLIATIVFIVSMILTFVVALVFQLPWLTIITVLIQYCAMTWYCLSYIPYARTAVLRVVGVS